MSHVLHAYLTTVRQKQEKTPLLLGNFDGAGSDLLEEFLEFFKNPKMRDWVAKDINAAARISKVFEAEKKDPDVIAALIKAGETGRAAEYVDTTEDSLGEDVLFKRGLAHAELVPVLILVKLPGTKDKGFVITHSPNNRGLKTKFWNKFKQWFSERHPDYLVELEPAAPEGFYRKVVEEQNLRKVTLIRYVKPADMIDDDSRWFAEQEVGKITTVIQPVARLGRLLKKDVVKVLKDEEGSPLSSLLVFHGEKYDQIRTTFRDDQGRQHSILLGENRTPRAGYDVTELLDFDDSENPTYESLRAAAFQYLDLLEPS